MRSPFRKPDPTGPLVQDRIMAVEVPVLTEVKRRLGRNDVAGALLYVYPKVLEDLGRAYAAEFPPGYAHEEILAHGFTGTMAPQAEFFERLYRLYAPVRYGHRLAPGSGREVLEIVKSLYAAEPMWRLYLTHLAPPAPANGGGATLPGPNGGPSEGS
ncbi:MAG TPA: hypothetical protein VJQ43_02820 [Thermoplasmata archaeon]|nr:hypothetical protein [Thermoplasmata archaeon]